MAVLEQVNIVRKGFMLVLSSPSGAGKTSIASALVNRNNNIVMSISATTRPKRPGEKDGKDYYFVETEKFEEMVGKKKFLEHAKVFENFYGTPRDLVTKNLNRGIDVLFDVDWQGTLQLKKNNLFDIVCIFILPPSLDILANRLRARALDTSAVVENRMSKAVSELSHWNEYDYVIINSNLEASIKQAESILVAERLKRTRNNGLADFVKRLGASKKS